MDEDSLEDIWKGLHSNVSITALQFDSQDKVLEQQTMQAVLDELAINEKINS